MCYLASVEQSHLGAPLLGSFRMIYLALNGIQMEANGDLNLARDLNTDGEVIINS